MDDVKKKHSDITSLIYNKRVYILTIVIQSKDRLLCIFSKIISYDDGNQNLTLLLDHQEMSFKLRKFFYL